MGSLGDGDGVIKPSEDNRNSNVAYTDAQLFDSQMFHSSLPGGWDANNETHELQSTVPFDDTVPVEDGFETQVDIGGETQVLDDQDCFLDYMETQLVDELDSDGEGTDKTEVLSDSDDELCDDDDSQKRGKVESLDGDIVIGASHEHKEGVSVEQSSENCNSGFSDSAKTSVTEVGHGRKSGSVPMFASVRVASLRASGLSARKLALGGTNCESSSPLPNNRLTEDISVKLNGSRTETWEEVHHMCDAEIYKEKVNGSTNANKCNVGRSTARKLFDKDDLVGNGDASSNDDTLGGNENVDLPICDDVLAGLSYIYSQEPSELSQANAFACVQKLIEESNDLFDNELDLGKRSKGKSNLSSTSKGVQILAKKIVNRNTNEKRGIFDWDDGQEDEGGGDILCRRMEEFFGSGNLRQRSFMKTQTAKSNVENATVHSDSKVSLQGLQLRDKTAQAAEVNVRKNLVNDFEEQSNIPSSAGHFETDRAGNDMPELLNVGLDTQMAAEAMEALFYADEVANDVPQNKSVVLGLTIDSEERFVGRKGKLNSYPKKLSFNKDHGTGVATRQTRSAKRIETRSSKRLSVSSKKHRENVGDVCLKDIVITRRKKAKSGDQGLLNNGMKIAEKLPPKIVAGHSESSLLYKSDEHNETAFTVRSVTKQNLPEEPVTCTPIARRTRQSIIASGKKSAENVPNGCGKETICQMDIGAQERSEGGGASVEKAQVLDAKGKSSKLVSRQVEELEISKSALTTSCPRQRRSSRRSSYQLKELDDVTKQSNQHEIIEKSGSEHKRPRGNAKTSSFAELSTKRKRQCSKDVCQDLSSAYQNGEEASPQCVDKSGPGDVELECTSDENRKKIYRDNIGAKEVKLLGRKNASPSAKHEIKAMSDNLPKEPSKSACTSPANCMTPANAASPICIGNEYFKKSCKKNLSNPGLLKEISSLSSMEREPVSPAKDLRKRRDLANVRVLLSNHLDEDTTKQLRKIVDRLKVAIATSITDATHFITDKFVRTRNMLEAIASGKSVVTHLWLENVGRAKYYIDEQKYILRDTKKEKEIGFNMQVSLEHARAHPILQSRRVFITPSTKPGKEIISGLVKAVGGQAVERVGRSTLKDDILAEHLLVLSCEEDYEECIPFLEKGSAVYSSELLLNGIITQKLEYERYQLFADHVKRTRSTIWLKKGGDNFIPVTKQK